MNVFLVKILSTFFYVGYLPFIPGTFGSLAGICLFFPVKGNTPAHIFLTAISLFLGFLTAGQAERIFRKKDAKFIVIDEVSGMLLSLLFIPYDIRLLFFAFFLFRILDWLKPYPARRLQGFTGSIGIMSDDIVAGIYTNLILGVVLRCVSFRIS